MSLQTKGTTALVGRLVVLNPQRRQLGEALSEHAHSFPTYIVFRNRQISRVLETPADGNCLLVAVVIVSCVSCSAYLFSIKLSSVHKVFATLSS